MNMVVVSIQQPLNNLVTSSLLNNIVETKLNNIVGQKMLLTHDNNGSSSVVHATTKHVKKPVRFYVRFLRVYH